MADMNNSGSTEAKIVSYPDNLTQPKYYEAPSSDNSQTQGTVNKIQDLSQDQIFNNACQGTGIAGPSVWGGAEDKKGSQSSAAAGTKQSNEYSVDLVSGQNNCWNGGNRK